MEKRFESLLDLAINKQCTDIHFDIVDSEISIALRTIDSLIRIPSTKDDLALFNYLQYKAHLDCSSNKPQSGSFTYFYNFKIYDFRLAVVNSCEGKNGVLRILNCHQGLNIQQLTTDMMSQEKLKSVLKQKSGLIIFSGLTGSGKTTTMYSLLKMMKNRIIYSLEDPIEVKQNNIIQLEVNEKLSFTYDEGIKQILRHNPDVLMIGEIRDEQTAKMAIRAALTGVLVLTSLHCSSAYNGINRMLELSKNKTDFVEVVLTIFNQKLVKIKNGLYSCDYQWLDNQEIRKYITSSKTKPFKKDKLSFHKGEAKNG